jgi:hypothetical protein
MLVAVPFAALSRRLVVDANVGSLPATVWWTAGTASALDAGTISRGRDTGSVVAYDRRLAGRELSFAPAADGRPRDDQTGSVWGRGGVAIDGPLAGRRLRPVVHDAPFWFALAAFRPGARIVTGSPAPGDDG